MDYLNDLDKSVIQKQTVRLISTVKTSDNPAHESIVLLTAKQEKNQPVFIQVVFQCKGSTVFCQLDERKLVRQ